MLKYLSFMHFFFVMFCMVEYIVETPPKVYLANVCNEIQVHHTCIYCGEFALYILVLLTSQALVVFYVSTIDFDMG